MLRRTLALVLALAVPARVPAEAAPRHAEERGLVEILPLSEARGDGATPLEVRVVAWSPDGAPLGGLRLEPRASSGSVAGWRSLGPGRYAFDFTPPEVSGATTVTLSLSGRTPHGPVDARLDVDVRAPLAHRVAATVTPERLTLGRAEGGTILVESARGVLVRASAGEVGSLTDAGGRKAAPYTPPRVNYPQVAIVTLADATDPGAAVGYGTVFLDGAVDYPVDVSPNASVTLTVGDRAFGPVVASPEGMAAVPIVVPPGVGTATVVSVVDGHTIEEELDLRIPETRRVALFPLPAVVPADSGITVPVRAVVVTPEGAPDPTAQPVFVASSGRFGAVTHEGDGVFVAAWTPDDADAAGSATVEVRLDDGEVQRDVLEVRTAPRRATRVTLAEPIALPDEGPGTIVVRAEGAGGPIAGRSVEVDARGATVEGTVDRGDGTYAIRLARVGGPVELDLRVPPDVTDNRVRHVMLAPGRDLVASDAADATTITVATVDAFGYTVPGIEVSLALESGDGTLAEERVTTDIHGLARVEYEAGSATTLVRLRATAGEATGAAAIVQAPAGTSPLDLEVGGAANVRALVASWDDVAVEWSSGGAPEQAVVAAVDEGGGPVAAKVAAPVEAGLAVERPWLRARLSAVAAAYRYEQAPSADPGHLLPRVLAVGGDAPPATPVGVELEARGWLEDLPFLGFHGRVRTSRYAVGDEVFREEAPDTLYDVQLNLAGRYAFAVGPDQLWVGGKLGFQYDDFVHFTGCLQADCTIDYGPIGLPGVGVGAEMGAEIADLFFVAGYRQGLAYATIPYSGAVDVDAGYQLNPALFAHAGFSAVLRRVALRGAETGIERGTLADRQLVFKVGAGLSF